MIVKPGQTASGKTDVTHEDHVRKCVLFTDKIIDYFYVFYLETLEVLKWERVRSCVFPNYCSIMLRN